MTQSSPTPRCLLVLFGDQLHLDEPALQKLDRSRDAVLMMEVSEEATHVPSHKQRTVLFLSAMRHFAKELRGQGFRVEYVALDDPANTQSFLQEMRRANQRLQPEQILIVEPGEWRVRRVVEDFQQECGVPLEILPDSHFLLSTEEFGQWASGRKEWILEHFYRWMRKRFGVLIQPNGEPTGGQWNFDKDNRQAFREDPERIPTPLDFPPDKITKDVMDLVEARFPDAPGELDSFGWPVTRADALSAAEDFFEHRLAHFGEFQDAMVLGQPWMYHSLLSPAMNLKLLNPRELIDRAVDAYENKGAPLNSVEGFIRQILGWREFIRGVYWHEGPEYRQRNELGAPLPLPRAYWDANSPLRCIREAVGEVLQNGFGHHIQRLMITGNLALLAGVQPGEISDWYLGMYVDGVDWVTLPNTLGMAMHADGGRVGTKPYAASGAYVNRMSNYCKSCRFDPKKRIGELACPITTLYWDFLDRHRARFSKNRRMGFAVKNLERIKDPELREIREHAAKWRTSLAGQ